MKVKLGLPLLREAAAANFEADLEGMLEVAPVATLEEDSVTLEEGSVATVEEDSAATIEEDSVEVEVAVVSGKRSRSSSKSSLSSSIGNHSTLSQPRPGCIAVEDEHVTKREDELLAQHVQINNASQPLLPVRPAYGAQGQPLLVWTNYFHLEIGDTVLFRYEVKVNLRNKEAPRAVAKCVIELLIIDYLRPLLTDAVSDLRATVITRHNLHENLAFDVVYRDEGEELPDDDAATYQVVLTPTGTFNMSELVDYTTSTSASRSLAQTQELLQALNIMIGYKSRTDPDTVIVGRTGRVSKASNQPRVSLGGGLEALRSFVFSARAATERVLVNVQIKNLPFLISMPLPKLLNEFRMAGGTPRGLDSFLRLVSVQVTHIRRRAKSGKVVPRYKTILGLANKKDGEKLAHPPRIPHNGANAKEVEFWLEDTGSSAGSSKKGKAKMTKPADKGAYISVFDFFQTRKSYQVCKFSGCYLF